MRPYPNIIASDEHCRRQIGRLRFGVTPNRGSDMGYITGQIILSPLDKENEWQFIAIAHKPERVQIIGTSKVFVSTVEQLRYPLQGGETRASLEGLLDDLIEKGWEPYGAYPSWSWWEYNIRQATVLNHTLIESSPGQAVVRPYESEEAC